MSERSDRFRQLDPTRRVNGDLFEHFGVTPAAPQNQLPPLPDIQSARACPVCAWFCRPSGACDHCGTQNEPA